ncbi:hypothetical protein P10VF_137 [Rhizobium phage vB_RleM_P10VF]|uniref:Uncharacterized protein n=2 Tax=Innesvirus TaxID=3044739 RepID=A0A076YLW6_9CAUD|nr:hypothetical protein P10VF_137 [Rhizobium phage vB_RleM_P10VF]YP_010662321.1 hypothetical protein PP938_gp171 [Rhizobium phage AF3]AIK68350.1 hypothetical protein P10VF_137 [Rhizobium phage vB_RleM_P10VF]QNH71523.1 hypothetical protein AF3_171 [Rhizobium phage AF3]
MAKKQQPESNFLSDFSDIIRQQGEDLRRREEETIEKAKVDLPYQIMMLPSLTNEFLVEWFDTCLNGAFSNTRLMEVLAELKEAIKNEILKRMEK